VSEREGRGTETGRGGAERRPRRPRQPLSRSLVLPARCRVLCGARTVLPRARHAQAPRLAATVETHPAPRGRATGARRVGRYGRARLLISQRQPPPPPPPPSASPNLRTSLSPAHHQPRRTRARRICAGCAPRGWPAPRTARLLVRAEWALAEPRRRQQRLAPALLIHLLHRTPQQHPAMEAAAEARAAACMLRPVACAARERCDGLCVARQEGQAPDASAARQRCARRRIAWLADRCGEPASCTWLYCGELCIC
jgi:hypothetical protein